jgi:hypothetical protein
MPMLCEPQPTRKGPVSYPCVACGSLVDFDQVYCPDCLKQIRYGIPRPDLYLDRILNELEQMEADLDGERY